ncbi:MAG: alpha/beta fold hydrolase [Candidatus Aminicenantes bacterium]|nr:alpha/beta fold hydrolase [Candidatus Aminicenantes bacterium]
MKEKVFFENSSGIKLCGILSNPKAEKEKPIVILCHGFFRSKDSKTYVELEKILNEKGLSTLRFDFFGHGESEGKFEEVTTSEAADDVLSAIKFLKESGYGKIGLMGSSFGGMASIIAASKVNDLYVLALKSPVSDYSSIFQIHQEGQEFKEIKEKGYTYLTDIEGKERKLNISFFIDAQKVNAYEAAKNIKIPTLIVHGDKDDSVPIQQSRRTASLMGNCRLEVIEGADHGYSIEEHFQKMLDLISRFIVERSQELDEDRD